MAISRRKFIAGSAVGVTGAALAQGPTIIQRTASRPVVVASGNGNKSRALWLEWKRRIDPSRYLDPKSRAEAAHRIRLQMMADGKLNRDSVYGTNQLRRRECRRRRLRCHDYERTGLEDPRSHRGLRMYGGREYAVCTEKGPQTVAADYLLTGTQQD